MNCRCPNNTAAVHDNGRRPLPVGRAHQMDRFWWSRNRKSMNNRSRSVQPPPHRRHGGNDILVVLTTRRRSCWLDRRMRCLPLRDITVNGGLFVDIVVCSRCSFFIADPRRAGSRMVMMIRFVVVLASVRRETGGAK
jgi:hypothetical protein